MLGVDEDYERCRSRWLLANEKQQSEVRNTQYLSGSVGPVTHARTSPAVLEIEEKFGDKGDQ